MPQISRDTQGVSRPAKVVLMSEAASPKLERALARQDPNVRFMVGLRARDEVALSQLYDATVGRIHGLALRILGDPQAAEEVVSDVYHQAWQEAERYDASRGQVQTWLLVICRSRALDALRRRDQALLAAQPDAALELQVDNGADVVDIVEAIEQGHAVRACLAALSASQRELVSLAFFKGLTHSEISRSRAMPLGSVKSQIRQALLKMRARLGEAAR